MKIKYLFLGCVFWGVTINAFGQMKQKIDMVIDPVGDAVLTVKGTLTASEWQMWNQNYGNNPALLKRNTELAAPGFFLDDFHLEKNDMERSFTVTVRAYGACSVNKQGKWQLATEEKTPDINKIDDRNYILLSTETQTGIQQTTLITFPPQAKNIELTKDAFNKTVFEFDMDTASQKGNNMQWAGLGLLVIGLALFFLIKE